MDKIAEGFKGKKAIITPDILYGIFRRKKPKDWLTGLNLYDVISAFLGAPVM